MFHVPTRGSVDGAAVAGVADVVEVLFKQDLRHIRASKVASVWLSSMVPSVQQ